MEIEKRLKIANDCICKDETRPFLSECYYKNEIIVSTDGKRLFGFKWILKNEGYCKIDTKTRTIYEINKPGPFPNWEHLVKADSSDYKSILLDIPKYFCKFKTDINAAINDNGEYILNYKDDTECIIKLNLQFLHLLAGETVAMHYKDKDSCVIFTENNLNDLYKQEWFYLVMPIR